MQNIGTGGDFTVLSERESLHKVKGKDRFDGKKSDILKIQGRQRGKKSDYFLK